MQLQGCLSCFDPRQTTRNPSMISFLRPHYMPPPPPTLAHTPTRNSATTHACWVWVCSRDAGRARQGPCHEVCANLLNSRSLSRLYFYFSRDNHYQDHSTSTSISTYNSTNSSINTFVCLPDSLLVSQCAVSLALVIFFSLAFSLSLCHSVLYPLSFT